MEWRGYLWETRDRFVHGVADINRTEYLVNWCRFRGPLVGGFSSFQEFLFANALVLVLRGGRSTVL